MTVTYDSEEKKIAESGVEGIRRVLFGNDTGSVLSLLLCLDYYLDPYYNHTLPYSAQVLSLLEELVCVSGNDDVIDSALQLLGDYGGPDYTIMKEGFSKIKDSMKPYAKAVINGFSEVPK